MPCRNLALSLSPSLPMERPGQLRELMVAQNVMRAVGILAFERRDDVEELMRAIAAVIRVRELARESAPARRGAVRVGDRGPRAARTFLNAGMLPCRSPTTITSAA